jgi:hypothetical protein
MATIISKQEMMCTMVATAPVITGNHLWTLSAPSLSACAAGKRAKSAELSFMAKPYTQTEKGAKNKAMSYCGRGEGG